MDELSDDQVDAALARGRAARFAEPRAIGARFDARSGRVILDLTNGCTFAFPARLAQGLQTATDAALSEVMVRGEGTGLNCPRLDTDLSVDGLLAGRLGTRAYIVGAKHV